MTAVDWHPAEPRFEVVYHLHSIERNERLRVKCRLSGANPEIDSVYRVWRGADWYEREVFDMFGIRFRNHPNLVRILMPVDWEGYPLRKDYPVHGYKYSYRERVTMKETFRRSRSDHRGRSGSPGHARPRRGG